MRTKEAIIKDIDEVAARFQELKELEACAREPSRPLDQLLSELNIIKEKREYWTQESLKLFAELGQWAFLELKKKKGELA